MQYWIFKTEPSEFSIEDLKSKGKSGEEWNGIRNFQARNFLRDKVKSGDQVLIYHSSCKEIGVVGLAEVIKEAFIDKLAFDSNSKYYDEKSDPEKPRWYSVQIRWVKTFDKTISLQQIKNDNNLKETFLVKRSRLSVGEINQKQFERFLKFNSL